MRRDACLAVTLVALGGCTAREISLVAFSSGAGMVGISRALDVPTSHDASVGFAVGGAVAVITGVVALLVAERTDAEAAAVVDTAEHAEAVRVLEEVAAETVALYALGTVAARELDCLTVENIHSRLATLDVAAHDAFATDAQVIRCLGVTAVPAALDVASVKAGLASALPAVQACGGQPPEGGTVRVVIRVAGDGSVSEVVVEGTPPPTLAACVEEVLRGATFARSKAGARFRTHFDL